MIRTWLSVRVVALATVATAIASCKTRTFSDTLQTQLPDWPVDNRYEMDPSTPKLSTTERNTHFQQTLATLNQIFQSNEPSQRKRITLGPKTGGGTSCYDLISLDGNLVGLFSPPGNGAGNIETEANSWSLARLFGVEDAFQPAGYVMVPQWGQDLFKAKMGCNGSDRWLQENRQTVLSKLGHGDLRFLVKRWDAKPMDADDSYDSVFRLLKSNSTSLAGSLNLNGGSQEKSVLAREFFVGLVVDVLQGQWDRFSGGNIQTVMLQGKVHMGWYDNGGASFYASAESNSKLQAVQRVPKSTLETVRALDDFLNTPVPPPFRDFKDRKAMRDAMQFINEGSWEHFKQNAAWVRKTLDQKALSGTF